MKRILLLPLNKIFNSFLNKIVFIELALFCTIFNQAHADTFETLGGYGVIRSYGAQVLGKNENHFILSARFYKPILGKWDIIGSFFSSEDGSMINFGAGMAYDFNRWKQTFSETDTHGNTINIVVIPSFHYRLATVLCYSQYNTVFISNAGKNSYKRRNIALSASLMGTQTSFTISRFINQNLSINADFSGYTGLADGLSAFIFMPSIGVSAWY